MWPFLVRSWPSVKRLSCLAVSLICFFKGLLHQFVCFCENLYRVDLLPLFDILCCFNNLLLRSLSSLYIFLRVLRLFVPAPDKRKIFHHVDTLGAHFNHPWVLHHLPRAGSSVGLFFQTQTMLAHAPQGGGGGDLPALNEVFEVVTPIHVHFRFILQFGHVLSYDVCE